MDPLRKMQIIVYLAVIILALGFTAGCQPAAKIRPTGTQLSPASPQPVTPTPTTTQVPTNSPTPTITPTLPPTDTPSPTETPTPEVFTLTTQRQSRVYLGPGDPYPVLMTFAPGVRIPVVGRSEDGGWWLIEMSAFQQGWVANQDVTEAPNPDLVPTAMPPTSLLPTNTPAPRLSISVAVPEDARAGRSGSVRITIYNVTPGVEYKVEFVGSWIHKEFKTSGSTTYSFTVEARFIDRGSIIVMVSSADGQSAQTSFTLK